MLRSSHILQLTVVALLGVAVVMVNSAGMTLGGGHASPLAMLTSRSSIYAALAVIAMLFASRINVRELFRARGVANPLIWIVAGSLVLQILSLIPHIGKSVNGSSRWLSIGPSSLGLSFQPSELVKWVMVLAIAWWCSRRRV